MMPVFLPKSVVVTTVVLAVAHHPLARHGDVLLLLPTCLNWEAKTVDAVAESEAESEIGGTGND